MHIERKMKTWQKKFFMNQEASSHWRRLQSRFFSVLSLSVALCAPYGSTAQTPPPGPPPPELIQPDWTNGQFSFTLLSEPGLLFEILASKNLAQPSTDWASLLTFTNTTGAFSFTDPATTLNQRFYRAHQLSYPRRPLGVYDHFDLHNGSLQCVLVIVKNSDFSIKRHRNEPRMNGG
jgi:hypothetical protein